MKYAWLAAAGLLTLATPVFTEAAPAAAQPAAEQPVDAERLALARDMMSVVDTKQMLGGMFAQMANSMRAPDSATPDQRERLKQLVLSMGAGMQAETPELMDRMAHVYARTFTVEEMRAAIAFYRSPPGQAMLAKLPQATREIAPLTMSLMPEIAAKAKVDYCSHRTCDKADDEMFAKLEAAYGGKPH